MVEPATKSGEGLARERGHHTLPWSGESAFTAMTWPTIGALAEYTASNSATSLLS